jgi:pimeloyl-ACP methyl ester carboxylesterase
MRSNAPTSTAFLLAIGLLTFSSLPVRGADYHVVSENTASVGLPAGELQLTNTVVQEGATALNRFTMHRLRRPGIPVRGSLLLLPALGNNFQSYLYSEDGDAAKSFAGFIARLGYEVWGYSPRETGITPGQCGAALDCTPALNWSMQTIVEDVGYIRSRIGALAPGKPPVIGGLSLGALSALAVVNQSPKAYSGLLAWEGSLVTDDPAIRAHASGFCNQFAALVSAGVAVDDQSLPFVKLVAQLAQVAPDAPFAIPVPGFPPGLTNRQAFVLILSTPNPIAPSPRPGFITAAGDVAQGTLFYSSQTRLAGNIGLFNDATSNRVGRDFYCSLAGVETAYSNNLTKFKEPVMVIKAGQGFGAIMDELPGKLRSKSVTFLPIGVFAHVDHLGSPYHLAVLELPVALWLGSVLD